MKTPFSSPALRPALTSLAAAIALSACGGGRKGPAADPSSGPGSHRDEIVRVKVTSLLRRPISSVIETVGTVTALSMADIYSKVSGVVTSLDLTKVEQGSEVQGEQILAQLDDRAVNLALRNAQLAQHESEQKFLNLFLTMREARAQLARSRDAEAEARREYENARRQSEQGLVSEDEELQKRFDWDQTRSDLQVARISTERTSAQIRELALAIERAKLEVEIQQQNIEDHKIRAPFDGVIRERHVQLGQLVSPTVSLFSIIDTSHLLIYLDRPQRERVEIAVGQRVEVLPSRSDLPYLQRSSGRRASELVCHRRVLRVSPSNDPASGTFRVTIGDPSAPISLAPATDGDGDAPAGEAAGDPFQLYHGRSVRVRIVLAAKKEPFLIAKKAVLREGLRSSVFVVRGDRAKRIFLDIGFSDDTHVEVLNVLPGAPADSTQKPDSATASEQLYADDEIVLLGQDELEDGTRVACEED